VSFLFPSLLWIGIPLIAVPVLIHLINLRRQQRVRWAAMQFLLVSQKQNRRWILFKQLLLLAARMAAVAVLVAFGSDGVARAAIDRTSVRTWPGSNTHRRMV